MGLTDVLSRAAASRAHVLVAEAAGSFRERVALERAVYDAGWCLADSVADADVLAVVGEAGPELMALVDHTWEQMSQPRARVEVHDGTSAASVLAQARVALHATGKQHVRAAPRAESPTPHGEHGHGGHDHGEMSPDGIPLAEGAEDRDGLEMDELHLPLGPVLAHWPAGVVLRLTLHGDVVTEAKAEPLDGGRDVATREGGPLRAAGLLDAAASVLALAGLPGEAARARRLRDACLKVGPGDRGALDDGAIADLSRRVRRNRTLRWMFNGLDLYVEDDQVAWSQGGSLHGRLLDLVDRAQSALEGGAGAAYPSGPTLETLPGLLAGHELAAVRLWMAALGPDLGSHLDHTVGAGASDG